MRFDSGHVGNDVLALVIPGTLFNGHVLRKKVAEVDVVGDERVCPAVAGVAHKHGCGDGRRVVLGVLRELGVILAVGLASGQDGVRRWWVGLPWLVDEVAALVLRERACGRKVAGCVVVGVYSWVVAAAVESASAQVEGVSRVVRQTGEHVLCYLEAVQGE